MTLDNAAPANTPADAGDGLQTARLRLRRYTPDDLDDLHRLNSHEGVMRYLGGVVSRTQTAELLANRILRYYHEHPGLGVWATVDKTSGAVIGFHLLNHIQGTEHIQVGYRLHPEHWGRGYATEMTRALLRYGFMQRSLGTLTAITHLDNTASQQVLLKSGLLRNGVREFVHPAYAGFSPLAWFECDAQRWLDAHPAG